MEELDKKADAFLTYVRNSKFSWAWIAGIFVLGWVLNDHLGHHLTDLMSAGDKALGE